MSRDDRQPAAQESMWLSQLRRNRSAADTRSPAEQQPNPALLAIGRARRALEDRRIEKELGLR